MEIWCKRGTKMKAEMFTSYQCLQGHATLAFGLATSGDVPEVVLQMPNAATKLMVDPLLGHGVLCFDGGVRGDVFRRCFGPNDFFRKQIEATRKRRGGKARDHTRKRGAG
jgi:hypothetical protein